MIAEVERARVKLMIAYRLHFERGICKRWSAVNSGKIGETRVFISIFSQQVKTGNSCLKADIGGGPIHDMGVYCINAARYLFRADPVAVMAWNTGHESKRRLEVTATTTAVMRFRDDRIASLTCSFGITDRSTFEVVGTKGTVRMDPAYELLETLKVEMTVGKRTTKRSFPKCDQFAPELMYFADGILNNKEPEPSGRQGLADVRIIEAILESAEGNRPVAVKQTNVSARPHMKQEIASLQYRSSCLGFTNGRCRLGMAFAHSRTANPRPTIEPIKCDVLQDLRILRRLHALVSRLKTYPGYLGTVEVRSSSLLVPTISSCRNSSSPRA